MSLLRSTLHRRFACWHRWVCRHGFAASECSSGPYRCRLCGALYEEVAPDA